MKTLTDAMSSVCWFPLVTRQPYVRSSRMNSVSVYCQLTLALRLFLPELQFLKDNNRRAFSIKDII